MALFDALREMDEELWEEEEETDAESMHGRQAVFIEEKGTDRGNGGLKFLIFLELLGILAVVWWWIKWLY